MPSDPLLGYDDPADPGYKLARGGGGGAGGRGAPPVAPPSGVVGGGYGSFFGSPTTGSVAFTSSPQRRMDYGGVPGFKSWMDPGAGASLPVGGSPPPGITMDDILSALSQHFALGGAVQPQPFLRRPGFGMPGQGGFPGVPTPGAPPGTGAPPAPTQGPAPGPMPATPSDPWGNTPFAPGSPNPGDETMARIWALLKQYGQSGAFSPGGSPAVMSAVKENALGAADAARQRAGTLSVLSGADPASRANYMLQTDLAGQGGAAQASNNAVLGQELGQQQFGQQLLGKAYDANTQAWLAQLAKWMAG